LERSQAGKSYPKRKNHEFGSFWKEARREKATLKGKIMNLVVFGKKPEGKKSIRKEAIWKCKLEHEKCLGVREEKLWY
jgi:hypothetical protein